MYKVIFFLFLLIPLGAVSSNLMLLKSSKTQVVFFKDANNNTFSLNQNILKKANSTYPSLAFNSVPILSYMSRYSSNLKDYNLAIEQLLEGLNYNPYNTYSLYLLASNYIYIDELKEAKKVLDKAYKLSPNIESIAALYFTVLAETKQTNQLIDIFKSVKLSNNITIWKFYIGSLLNTNIINNIDKEFLSKVEIESFNLFKQNILEN